MAVRLLLRQSGYLFSVEKKAVSGGYRRRDLTTADFPGGEYSGQNAYEVLGISEKSSSAEIKASFRKLAKETHPDVCASSDETAGPRRFLQILSAYEILSDSERRAHYDIYLLSQKKELQKKCGHSSALYTYYSSMELSKPNEVVEWLKWYKNVIDDIVTQKKVATGDGYFDKLEGELFSAINFAYYGPIIESMNLLPDRFEAEERSLPETSEVLHLVSGRYLFGIIYTVKKAPKLSHAHSEKLASFVSSESESVLVKYRLPGGNFFEEVKVEPNSIYNNLELHISGKLVATATRNPPKCKLKGGSMTDDEDRIDVFLSLNESVYTDHVDPQISNAVETKIHLGTITGLGNYTEEGICSVYNANGQKTHIILKHRTFLVKHMHWFQVGEDEIATYECRCTRARLPPSKFWLFEPRSCMHDIGGWYVETFGLNRNGRTVLSRRHWDGINERPEKRLHPAIYLLTLAYRTLDLEDQKRRKVSVRDILEPKVRSILRWCKRLL